MGNKSYIRRPAVFNPDSDREKRIWNWIENSTNNFKGQNFAAFVRDKLEWCMLHEGGQFVATANTQEAVVKTESKQGWSRLL
jgi:hypothetical protein